MNVLVVDVGGTDVKIFATGQKESRRTRTGVISCCSTNTSTVTTELVSAPTYQTGWTGGIARAMHVLATSAAEQVLELGKRVAVTEVELMQSGQPMCAGDSPGQ